MLARYSTGKAIKKTEPPLKNILYFSVWQVYDSIILIIYDKREPVNRNYGKMRLFFTIKAHFFVSFLYY